MPNQISLPLVHWRRLPPIFCLSIGALLGLLLAAFVLGERSAQKNRELLVEFGNALAQLSAKDVVNASISHDLVGMHVVMQEVHSQPRVVMAAVHDLDQNLLVQAGQPRVDVRTQSFSAPIPLHDSIAGHVTITLITEFPGETALVWALIGTAVLLLFMAALSLYETRGYAWEMRKFTFPEKKRAEEPEELPEPDPVADSDDISDAPIATSEWEDEPQEAVLRHSDLVLAVTNRQKLEQQLNGDRFAELVSRFETTLEEVLALYGGVPVGAPTKAGIYCIRFTSSESASEAAFRAVCCAHLIYQLNLQHKIRFQVVAEICHPEYDVKLAVSDTGIVIQAALMDELLDSRLETLPLDEERVALTGFKAPYKALLDRQQGQLLVVENS